MPETCTVSWQKKFGQLECLVGYLKRKVNTKFLGFQIDNYLNDTSVNRKSIIRLINNKIQKWMHKSMNKKQQEKWTTKEINK